MPSLDIGDGAFDLLFETYKTQRKSWGQNEYLQYAGNIVSPERLEVRATETTPRSMYLVLTTTDIFFFSLFFLLPPIDLSVLQKFLEVIGSKENEIFAAREVNEAEFQKKKRRWDKRDGIATKGPTEEELVKMEKEREQKYKEELIKMSEGGTKKKKTPSSSDAAREAADDEEDDDGMILVKPKREKKQASDSNSDSIGQSVLSSKDWQGRYYYEKLEVSLQQGGDDNF